MKQGQPPDFRVGREERERYSARDDEDRHGPERAVAEGPRHGAEGQPHASQCITCHRGVPEPKQIGEILSKTSAEKGFPAAAAQYDELKAKYYGAQAYDFTDRA